MWIEIISQFSKCKPKPVAPRVGVWIEILLFHYFRFEFQVAPRVGVWIEIVTSKLLLINCVRRSSRRSVD